MKTLTDNWLVETAAALVLGHSEPMEEGSLLALGPEAVTVENVSLASIQVVSLLSLLEHIVLSDGLVVMGEYSDHWRDVPGLGELQERGMVDTFDRSEAGFAERRKQLISELRKDPRIKEADDRGIELYRAQQPSMEMQVIRAVATHVVASERLDAPYTPHPARGRFLRSTLLSPRGRGRAQGKLAELVTEGRVRVMRATDPDEDLVELHARLPPIGLVCLLESSASSNPFHIALQLRDDPEVASLRGELARMERALAKTPPDVVQFQKGARRLEAAVKEAHRQLRLRVEADGPTQISVKGLPLRLPVALQRPIPTPKFSSLMRRLVTPQARLVDVLRERLGIRDERVLEDLRNPELW